MENQAANRRVQCVYTEDEQDIIEAENDIFHKELRLMQRKNKKMLIRENQKLIAFDVVRAFTDSKIINMMVVSRTQSGKTGSMCATIELYITNNIIPMENIYIITGLSSCEWKEQTKERMPKSIQARVFHRCELPKTFVKEVKDKKNILIIMDEIQIAANKGQTIRKTFEAAELLNKTKLYANDVKIVEYTATPDGTIYDLMNWGEASCKILAKAGEGYVSCYDLRKAGRVKQFKSLCAYDKDLDDVNETLEMQVFENIAELKQDVDNFPNARYHIIRTKKGLEQAYTIDSFKNVFDSKNYCFITYDVDSEIRDINDILEEIPEKHTFIFIKEMLRCSKTLTKTYLGVLYERFNKKPNDAVIIQGLLGRDTGYDNNGDSICYTNIDSIERYEKLWNSGFEDKSIIWNSLTTSNTGGMLKSKGTFNEPLKDWDASSVSSNESQASVSGPHIEKCKTQEQAKEYYDRLKKSKYFGEDYKGRGPRLRKPNKDGFYETTVGKGPTRTRVYSCEEIYNIRKWNFDDKHKIVYHPCYEDTNDKDSVWFWLIHY